MVFVGFEKVEGGVICFLRQLLAALDPLHRAFVEGPPSSGLQAPGSLVWKPRKTGTLGRS